jgi:glutaminyl-tRNA synthetase
MYDFAHSLSDAIEGITHSLCSLEFQDHRPLYDWCVDHVSVKSKPRQIEFARFNLSHTITSKRKLKILVDEGHVAGWDDPRMPTLVAMRRRGYPPAAIREFCHDIGVAKSESIIDMGMLEEKVRDHLNQQAPRAMAVLDPIKIVIENYPEDKVETLQAPLHPQKPEWGERSLPFGREIYIEREDFSEDPPKKFFRLAPGKEVRLRNAYVIQCQEVIKDPQTGKIIELRCRYDEDTLGRKPEGRKVKGVIHWVSAAHAVAAEVRLYDRLFNVAKPSNSENIASELNPHSLQVIKKAYLETGLSDAQGKQTFQFERAGYFCVDPVFIKERLVFNRIVSLKDTWKKS